MTIPFVKGISYKSFQCVSLVMRFDIYQRRIIVKLSRRTWGHQSAKNSIPNDEVLFDDKVSINRVPCGADSEIDTDVTRGNPKQIVSFKKVNMPLFVARHTKKVTLFRSR